MFEDNGTVLVDYWPTEEERRDKWYQIVRSDPALIPIICSLLDMDDKLKRPFHAIETGLPRTVLTKLAKKKVLKVDGEGLFRVGDPSALAWAVARHKFVQIRLMVWSKTGR